MNTPESGSIRELARRWGKDEKSVRKAKAAGKLAGFLAKRGKREIVTDLAGALAALRAGQSDSIAGTNADTSAIADQQPTGSVISAMTLVEAQRIATLERSRKLRMENDLREGSLVEIGKAARLAFEAQRTIRESLLNIPARLAAELAAETDAARVHIRLDGALREALMSAADGIAAVAVNE